MKEHAKPIHIKKRLNNSSICGHGYSQKRVKKKNLEFVHSKDKVNNCSICYFSFYRIDILQGMPIIFMKKGCHKTYLSCDFDSPEKVNLKEHVQPVHMKKRLNNSSICDHSYSQKRVM